MGAVAINIGLVASLVGTLIGWFLLVSEISHVAGKDGVFPKVFTKTNKNKRRIWHYGSQMALPKLYL